MSKLVYLIRVIKAEKVCSTNNSLSPIFSYIKSHWGEIRIKEYYYKFTYTFLAFSCYFFHQKICIFIILIFFWQSIKFPQHNINQSETGIGDKILSVELFVNHDPRFFLFFWLLVDGQYGKWNWGGVPSPLNRWYYHTRDFVLQTFDSTQLWNGYVTYQRFGGKRWCCIFDNIYQWLVRFFGTNALLVPVSFKEWNGFFHKTISQGLYCSKFTKNNRAWIQPTLTQPFICSRSTMETLEIRSKLTINTLEDISWPQSTVFIVKFEQISHIVIVFPNK